jgi:hypothetical protein
VRAAALQRLQQTQGNRAARRLVQRLTPALAGQRAGCGCADEREAVQTRRARGPVVVQAARKKQTRTKTKKGRAEQKAEY